MTILEHSEPTVTRLPGESTHSAGKFIASGRLRSLDGLRGVAALVVLLHHSTLIWPTYWQAYDPKVPPLRIWSLWWWIVASPLHLLTAGSEAVLVFFILSGFVVTLPVLHTRAFDWAAYYPRRLVRLYVPVGASVVLEAFWVACTHQDPAKASSGWIAAYSFPTVTWEQLARTMNPLLGAAALNNPLWSLQWEVVFSLMLPLFVVGALATRRWWLGALLASAMVVRLGIHIDDPYVAQLPVFFLGSIAAARFDDLQRLASRLNGFRWPNLTWICAALAALSLLCLHAFLWGAGVRSRAVLAIAQLLTLYGALLVVIVAAIWSRAVSFLCRSIPQWLGRISFSLYLVHVPIIVAVSSLVGLRWHLLATSASSCAISLVVAELFSRVVEQPSHRLSKAIGRAASAQLLDRTTNKAPTAGV